MEKEEKKEHLVAVKRLNKLQKEFPDANYVELCSERTYWDWEAAHGRTGFRWEIYFFQKGAFWKKWFERWDQLRWPSDNFYHEGSPEKITPEILLTYARFITFDYGYHDSKYVSEIKVEGNSKNWKKKAEAIERFIRASS